MRKMKDSGIEWIGNIPYDWKLVKYKNFTINGMGNTILQTELVDEGIPVYSSTKDNKIFGYIKEPKIKVFKGDLVIPARGNSIGCAKLIKDELATCTQTTIYSHVYGINNSYLYYCTIGLKEYWFEFDKTAIPQITVRQVDNNIVPIPSLEEQELIAYYLDNKVKKIDNIISKTKETIEEYKKYKQSVITEAVTKGLNPDVEMKDSGIEWIGEIPKDWESIKLKNLIIESNSGEVIDKRYWNIGNEILYSCSKATIMCNYSKFPEHKRTVKGDLLLTRNATPYIFIPEENAIYTNVVQRIKLKDKVNLRFIKYMLESSSHSLKGYGDIIESFNMNVWGNTWCTLPSIQEQDSIVNYLDNKVSKIDSIISKKQELITQLEEYKKSLIYEYVTGKKEVSPSYAD